MTNSNIHQGLWSENDQQIIPLQGMHVHAELQDLLSEVIISQTFINEENHPIEAVYTFPLPIDAVLLSFSVTLGKKLLNGVVQERRQAEAAYEEAISDGNTAIMLQQLEAGLYTVNVGNLLSNEIAIICFKYTQLHHWTHAVLRWHLPTVLAPRYGKPSLESHQVPDVNLAIEHRYTLSLSIKGLLRTAACESPSHAIEIQVRDENTFIQLKEGRSFLDRDLILNLRLASDKASAICDQDFDGYVALASFYPTLPETTDQQLPKSHPPRLIKLLVDCSGSMAGESIGQTRIALLNIIESLNEQDRFSLTRFGSSIEQDIYKPLQATAANIALARNIVAKIEADLGGTEIFSAIEQTINLAYELEPADILLITDGEVWDEPGENSQTNTVIQLANQNQHRIFTVGVGSSVSERLVREVAEGTQGACELVNPGEGMAEKIERHFKRIYSEQAKSIVIDWSTQSKWQTKPKHFFIGDTLHIFAKFQDKPEGKVKLTADMGNELFMEQSVDIKAIDSDGDISTLARLIASQQLNNLTGDEKIALAVKYQLMTEETAYLVVDVKPEELKTDGLPNLRKISHMLAAGWGGVGSGVDDCGTISYDMGSVSYDMDPINFDMESVIDDLGEYFSEALPIVFSQADLLKRGDQIMPTQGWIVLPFPDDMDENEAELFIDGERVLARGLMQVKLSSRLQLKINAERCVILAGFDALSPIIALEIEATDYQLKDSDLALFVHLSALRTLHIENCYSITDRGLAMLATITQLQILKLNSCNHMTDRGLAELTHLAHMQQLTLSGCPHFTDQGLAKLIDLEQLQKLELIDWTQISDQGFTELGSIPHLQEITVLNCPQITNYAFAKMPPKIRIKRK